jgi:acid stress-induced BolA-like protein IbaG/YrbA
MFEMEKTLIVVYKDEMLVNQLKKLVETKDDNDNGEVVGTTDNSINIVAWNEKVWLENKKAGNIKSKVLFLGSIKGTDKLIPVIDVKYDKHGVKYGWAGNQAIVYANPKEITNREKYVEFINDLSNLPVPDIVKNPKDSKLKKVAENLPKFNVAETIRQRVKQEKVKVPEFLQKAKKAVKKEVEVVGEAGSKAVNAAEDLFRDKNIVMKQQLFYGVVNLYNNDLEQFMNL